MEASDGVKKAGREENKEEKDEHNTPTSESFDTTFFTTAGNRSAQSLPLATIYKHTQHT